MLRCCSTCMITSFISSSLHFILSPFLYSRTILWLTVNKSTIYYHVYLLIVHSWNTEGEPELIASGVSPLLVCMALHPQITCRHCTKFSVAPLSIWTSQSSSTVCSLVVFDSHRRIGKLPSSYSFTVSAGWIHLYHVSVHSPPCLCQ